VAGAGADGFVAHWIVHELVRARAIVETRPTPDTGKADEEKEEERLHIDRALFVRHKKATHKTVGN
jgi:hypothetical protein